MLVAYYEEFVFVQDSLDEMAVLRLYSKFPGLVQGEAHGASEPFLGCAEGLSQVKASGTPDNHEVDVAFGEFFGSCNGPINERTSDAVLQGEEKFAKHVYEAGGLEQKAPKFGKEGAGPVGLVIHAIAVVPTTKNTGMR